MRRIQAVTGTRLGKGGQVNTAGVGEKKRKLILQQRKVSRLVLMAHTRYGGGKNKRREKKTTRSFF